MTTPPPTRATRLAYDTVAADYAKLFSTELESKPLDRGLLGVFAEFVRSAGLGPVADVGCGPGRVTTYLSGLGLDAFGVDLSPGMIEIARARYPELRFEVGAMAALDLADGTLGGVLAWYSIIHTPPEQLAASFAELGRVLAPGGHLLLAFQAGDDDHVHREEAYGHAVSLDSYRHSPDRVAELLERAGIPVHTRVLRDPDYVGWETSPQAYFLARRELAAPSP
ncbi:MAG TPA: methyltransferase domain-containing protein [Nocardioidaceae bacterium]|nr:methyltransferase domain-containing protein [Nocardioidaceae bacterium]